MYLPHLMIVALALGAPAEQPPALRLTLREAIERARAASATLAQLRAQRSAAAAEHDLARSGRLPQLELTAGYTRYSDVPELTLALPGQTPRTIFPNIPANFRTRLGVALPVYTGGRLADLIEATRLETAATEDDIAAFRSELDYEVAVAYWALVTQREWERVFAEALQAFDGHLKDARNREQVGLAARSEVLGVQVERDRALLERLRAQNAAQVAEANLVRLLDLATPIAIETAEPLETPASDVVEPERLVSEALASRPERAALAARIDAATVRVRAEQALRRPQLQVGAGYDYSRPNRRILPLVAEWDDSWDVSLNLSLNVFDGGRVAAAASRASARRDALRHQLADFDRRIRLQVTRACLDLETARAGVAVAESGLGSGRENRRVTAERYKEGVAASSELLDAEVALQRAGVDRTEAVARVRLAEAALARALGK